MAVWSSILRAARQKLLQNSSNTTALIKNGQARCMSEERTFIIRPSSFQWHKTKDYFHLYFLLGAIPVLTGITLVNVFVGPATLQEIPEDYVPKEWEYLRHPIQRFLQRYFFPSPQQEYEKYLHQIYHESQLRKVRLLEQQVNIAMGTRRDYRSSYFREFYGAKYLHHYKSYFDKYNPSD
ncbi:PREDICTED: NADH dehydrogenase [ubiquinone] 1 beta subcomplex subunit 5, mitochondrial [Cyphomyrmex costatus]|uniref:NADH dehydrogenase [ubiquinone] 1 beta subcomplex subunit 5, mitochondrial n=1 Tax=Cyphomyrmex costatus TaxID=456900 RepID=A0A195CCS3_9HYME|nr:PREDICTED: NADH dehydrogenase [ubiquinone] 1 beta subcomplex subunit 5, mitochondrial [Cyphomyrmex costatus]KYM98602.1 NADH dehydrogenase [ubiquinone] 1 beta subcomplex subunit 5, mitochondrial [Cyphomyrmex costatus]